MNLTLFISTSSLERWFVQKAPRKIREGSGLVRIFESCLVVMPRMFGGRSCVFLAYLASPNRDELVGPSSLQYRFTGFTYLPDQIITMNCSLYRKRVDVIALCLLLCKFLVGNSKLLLP